MAGEFLRVVLSVRAGCAHFFSPSGLPRRGSLCDCAWAVAEMLLLATSSALAGDRGPRAYPAGRGAAVTGSEGAPVERGSQLAAPGDGHGSGPGAAPREKQGFPETAFPEIPVVGSQATPAPPRLAHLFACCLELKGLLFLLIR